jgi:hypothetical protein
VFLWLLKHSYVFCRLEKAEGSCHREQRSVDHQELFFARSVVWCTGDVVWAAVLDEVCLTEVLLLCGPEGMLLHNREFFSCQISFGPETRGYRLYTADGLTLDGTQIRLSYDIWYDIFFNCSWVDTRWQQYSTHLQTKNTQNNTIDKNNT